MERPLEKDYRNFAKEYLSDSGDMVVPDDASVSICPDGAYVDIRVWVSRQELNDWLGVARNGNS